jgi:hypothetical protein
MQKTISVNAAKNKLKERKQFCRVSKKFKMINGSISRTSHKKVIFKMDVSKSYLMSKVTGLEKTNHI